MLDKKAYTEVFYIINEMSDEMKNKIPKDVIDNIKRKMDNDYKFNIENNDFENVELLEDTEKILSVLYTDYLSTDEEKELILNMENLLKKSKDKNINKIKNTNVNSNNLNTKLNNIFDNSNNKELEDKVEDKDIDTNNKLIDTSLKKWLKDLINKFFKIFKKEK